MTRLRLTPTMDSNYRRPIGIDLFSGVGGLSLGFEQAGFDIVTSVEYDPVHAAVHAFNFPLTEVICADASTVQPPQVIEAAKRGFLAHGRLASEWTGKIDVIFGGPPCQGFSTMGKRKADDDRNNLVYVFADLVGFIQPRYFVMENVPGMVAGGDASILPALIDRFHAYGYEISIASEEIRRRAILNAADFGAPQDRRRLILIGSLRGEPMALYPPPTVARAMKRAGRAGKRGAISSSSDGLPIGPTVWDAIGDIPDLDHYEVLLSTDEVHLPLEDIQKANEHASDYARRLRGEIEDAEDFSYPRLWDPGLLTSSMRTEHTAATIKRFRETPPGETEEVSRFYRLDPNGLCNTLRAGTGSERGAHTSPRPIHPTSPRVISVREAARLHSFPDWFRLHRTKWHGFRSVGNAVPPLLGRAIGRSIMRAMDIHPVKPGEPINLGNPVLLSLNRTLALAYFGAPEQHALKSRTRVARENG